MIAAQIAPNSVKALNPNFGVLAKAYGALGRQLGTFSGRQNDLVEAFSARVPTLIHMPSDLLNC